MTGLRRAILFMLVFLAVFFNIERLDYGEQTLINLQTFVYVLVSALILGTLFLRSLQKIPIRLMLPLWLGLYLAFKLTLFHDHPFIGGVYTYVSITEMALIAIAALLTENLVRALNDLEGVNLKFIFPNRNSRVKDLSNAEEDIKNELVRSRRYNRPLSVIVVKMDKVAIKKNLVQEQLNIEKIMMNRFVLASLGKLLTKVVRRTDLIVEPDEQDGFIVLCPETNTEGVSLLAHRIQDLAQQDLGLTVQCGTAAFPEEAITFDDLLHKARYFIFQSGEESQLTINDPAIMNSTDESRKAL